MAWTLTIWLAVIALAFTKIDFYIEEDLWKTIQQCVVNVGNNLYLDTMKTDGAHL